MRIAHLQTTLETAPTLGWIVAENHHTTVQIHQGTLRLVEMKQKITIKSFREERGTKAEL